MRRASLVLFALSIGEQFSGVPSLRLRPASGLARAPLTRLQALSNPEAPVESHTSTQGLRPEVPPYAVALEENVNAALRGDYQVLTEVLAPDFRISDAALDGQSVDELTLELMGVVKLMEDPRVAFVDGSWVDKETLRLTWVASGTWGVPWKPRIVATGKADVRVDPNTGKATSAATTWDKEPLTALLSQVLPKYWDFRTWFAAPTAELAPFLVLGREKAGDFQMEIRRYLPRTVLRLSFVDTLGRPLMGTTRIVPDFAINGELITAGRLADRWWSTGEPEVRIRKLSTDEEQQCLFQIERGINATSFAPMDTWRVIEWDLTLPTRNGVDAAKLPLLQEEFRRDLDCVVDGDYFLLRRAQYAVRDAAIFALCDAGPISYAQDKGIPGLRKRLADSVADSKRGFRVKLDDGRPLFAFMKGGTRVGFNEAGALSICAYEPRGDKAGCLVSVEVEETNPNSET